MPDNYDSVRLSWGDALFLYLEREGTPLNVASLCVFDGVIPLELCTDFIESKLPLIPRYRQRAVAPPFNIGLPSWEYDHNFDIHNHVRELTLKRGTDAELKTVTSKILSARMNREHPLWDFTLLQGLKGNRTGMVIRVHHSLADGISGVGIMNVIMDPNPVAPPPPKKEHFHAPPQGSGPSLLDGLIDSCISTIQRVLSVQTDLLNIAQYIAAGGQNQSTDKTSGSEGKNASAVPPGDVSSSLGELTRLLPQLGTLNQRLPFNVVCKGPQKFAWFEVPIPDLKAAKNACGATLNDVILAIFTATIRRYAEHHDVNVENRFLRIVVPVNIRGNGDVSELGNRITFLPVDVPMDIRDLRELVAAVRQAMARLRVAHVGELVGILGTVVTAMPTPLQAVVWPMASQLPLSVCNTICTNVPGPQIPLYLLGRKMLACYPYVPIGGELGMNSAVLSYNGTAFFGFTGDAHAIPDLDLLPKFLNQSCAELRKLGAQSEPRAHTTPAKKRATRVKRASGKAVPLTTKSESAPAPAAAEPPVTVETPAAAPNPAPAPKAGSRHDRVSKAGAGTP